MSQVFQRILVKNRRWLGFEAPELFMGEANKIKDLSRCLTPEEFRRALDMAKLFNLEIIR